MSRPKRQTWQKRDRDEELRDKRARKEAKRLLTAAEREAQRTPEPPR